ncbi:4'-phosphopantetheinyl transferase superfamily protein [Pricia sp. S334]|uniref:4'-phosphopantetheinyl transferase superfamily protein n=1 Tax=Pricia mediterranea TaxID=3076079 RepID=A0ABU3L142_9FLAO|nr:4'-phosphopantetheinyl transferase superfamily protein [Pricia sp. S334]MDT7827313.1 4'-phosphopantetheinyl transferase superfamily protein [Pricia sp. S334]
MILPAHEVHLWHTKVDELSTDMDFYKNLLSPAEIQKADSFKFVRDRRVYTLARGLLRTLSGRYLNRVPAHITFDEGEYGKPYFNFDTAIKFNISHSGNRIVLAFVRNNDIGVDIESIKNDFEVMEVARHFFSSDEILVLEALPEKAKVAAFYRCWTRKESFIKAKGMGLSLPLTSFSVSLDVESAELLRTAWDAAEKSEWYMFGFAPDDRYIGALAVRGHLASVRQMKWVDK